MSESGLLLNVTTSDTSEPVLRRYRKRVRVISNGDDDLDNVISNKVPASRASLSLFSELKGRQTNAAIGLQSFISRK